MIIRPRATRRLAGGALAYAAIVVALLAGGCGSKTHTLESGYVYEPLNSTSVERRAFYADPYSIEARRAEAERQQRASEGSPLGLP